MRRALGWTLASVASLVLAPGFACAPIQGTALSSAPLNSCPEKSPCEAYVVSGTKAQCNDGRCELGRPDYPFTMVVNVPSSSYYAPGRTLALTSADLQPPTGLPGRSTCLPPSCVQLPALAAAQGTYQVTAEAAAAVGLPLPEGTALPMRAQFVSLAAGSSEEAVSLGFPLDDRFASSRVIDKTGVAYIDAVSVGRYLRIAYPEPPFDEFFPPVFDTLAVTGELRDDLVLGDARTPLDDDTGERRKSTVTRAEGLDGWRVWLADASSGRRISSLRKLAGKVSEVRLDTVGQSQAGLQSLRQGVEVIVAPPEDWLGVPRLQSPLIGGQGLELVEIPTFLPPQSLTGLVADEDAATGVRIGIPSRLVITSNRIRVADGTLRPLFRYTTVLATDEAGRFSTVVPPGLYDVTVEPAEGTGFSKYRTPFDTEASADNTFRPPVRTRAAGRVVLADGRALAEASVLAIPSERTSATGVKPRPAHTRTDAAGAFRLELDQGQYDLFVDPQAGTGFPRVVQLRSFAADAADIGEIVVGPPARLSVALRDPIGPNNQVGNPIVGAMVRIFAELPGRGPPAVEIGRATTDTSGRCEILLAQQAR